jgi:hypothetical protein
MGPPRRIDIFLLALIAILLLAPKAALWSYMQTGIPADFGRPTLGRAMLQDLALCILVFGALCLFIRRATWVRAAVGYLGTAILLSLLLFDVRVRELWARPLGWDLVVYYRKYATDLADGAPAFWNHEAGFGANFQWLFTMVLLVHAAIWGMLVWGGRQAAVATPSPARLRPIGRLGLTASACLGIAAICVLDRRSPAQVWSAEKNPVYDYASGSLRAWFERPGADAEAKGNFDQPLRPLAEAIGPRREQFAGTRPFSNVVIIMMESVRWVGMGLDQPASAHAPALHAMARDGLLLKCYVSVPHSAKSEYAILTGRYPFPGFAMKESLEPKQTSLLWTLREQLGVHACIFSTASLWFENTRGLLSSCGAETVLSIPDMLSGEKPTGPRTPYGLYDAPLVSKFAATMAQTGRPFAAVVLTHAAHYPYMYPGKLDVPNTSIEHYWASVKYLDGILGEMIEQFRAEGVLDDTLFVFVGDHGESFGEHGTYIHNNSMYEEEISVPLLFWSADGRLRTEGVQRARQIDIAPTVADLMGVREAAWPVQGVSIAGRNSRDTAYCASFFAGISRCIMTGSQKWVYFSGTRPVAYDLDSDPGEKHGRPLTDAEAADGQRRLDAFEAYERGLFGR